MKRDVTFAVDVDGVLRDNLQIMVDLYNKRFNESMSLNDVKYFDVSKSFPKFEEAGIDGRKWFFQAHAVDLFVDANPCAGAISAMKILKEHGNVVIVTNQIGTNNKERTLEWLETHRIPYDSILFTPDKHLLNCDVMVDDNPAFFFGTPAIQAVIIDAPYNINVSPDEITSMENNIRSVLRFKTLYDYALTLNN